ncbi:MAG TPA: HDOD domain-containing protein [Opitutaceae bacterium]|nr:HDOD domain-containing protein [Opitutaceae bacterium]
MTVSREALLHVVKNLPAAPQILAQLGGLLLDVNTDLDDLVKLINRDAALTTRIIRVSNSPLYNVGSPFASLEESLARVGFTEVYRLTGFAAMAQVSEKKLALYGWSSAQLRENSLLTALVAEALADPSKMDPRAAYTAGLLRSTGKIALDRLAKGLIEPDPHAAHKAMGLAAWETKWMGLTNCDAAATILQEWRFPAETIAGIRDHYLLGAKATAPLAILLNVAAGAAERCGYALTGETHYFDLTPEKYAAVELTEDGVQDAVIRAFETFNQVRSAVG